MNDKIRRSAAIAAQLFPKCRVIISHCGDLIICNDIAGIFRDLRDVEFEAKRMSIADHFHHAPDAGFIRNYDGDTARRQFRVSMVLVVVIAIAAAALGAVVRFDSPTQLSGEIATPTSPPHYAGKL